VPKAKKSTLPNSSSSSKDSTRESSTPPLETTRKKRRETPKKKAQSKTTKGKNHSCLKGWDSLEVVEETIFPEGYEQDKDHLPLYRQQTIFARLGLHAPRDTLNHWNLESLELLRPIAEAIHQECLASS
jgi:hypothetical protein